MALEYRQCQSWGGMEIIWRLLWSHWTFWTAERLIYSLSTTEVFPCKTFMELVDFSKHSFLQKTVVLWSRWMAPLIPRNTSHLAYGEETVDESTSLMKAFFLVVSYAIISFFSLWSITGANVYDVTSNRMKPYYSQFLIFSQETDHLFVQHFSSIFE